MDFMYHPSRLQQKRLRTPVLSHTHSPTNLSRMQSVPMHPKSKRRRDTKQCLSMSRTAAYCTRSLSISTINNVPPSGEQPNAIPKKIKGGQQAMSLRLESADSEQSDSINNLPYLFGA